MPSLLRGNSSRTVLSPPLLKIGMFGAGVNVIDTVPSSGR